MNKQVGKMICAGLLALCCALPGFALAAPAPDPAPPINASIVDAPAAAEGDAVAISAAADTPVPGGADGVTLASENTAAKIADAPFALDGFSRAQVGSNRDIDGSYSGYCYYAANAAGKLT
ncbi:MAG: hypothetical protein RR655_04620, partial [Raoultibacter sp.]